MLQLMQSWLWTLLAVYMGLTGARLTTSPRRPAQSLPHPAALVVRHDKHSAVLQVALSAAPPHLSRSVYYHGLQAVLTAQQNASLPPFPAQNCPMLAGKALATLVLAWALLAKLHWMAQAPTHAVLTHAGRSRQAGRALPAQALARQQALDPR